MQDGRSTHLITVVKLAGVLLLFVACLGVASFGWVVATTHDRYSPVVGVGALLLSMAIVYCLADQFVKCLTGLFGIAVLKGLFAVVTGHLFNDQSVITRSSAILLT